MVLGKLDALEKIGGLPALWSLYDLEKIGGLPILGDIYEELLPRNEDLMDAKKLSPIVLELLRTHAELCRFIKVTMSTGIGGWIIFIEENKPGVLLVKSQKKGHCLALHESLKGITFRL